MGCNKGKNEKIDSYEVSQLNEAIAQFFAELRKENDKASLDRYLRSKNYAISIDAEFLLSRKVLEAKARKLRELSVSHKKSSNIKDEMKTTRTV